MVDGTQNKIIPENRGFGLFYGNNEEESRLHSVEMNIYFFGKYCTELGPVMNMYRKSRQTLIHTILSQIARINHLLNFGSIFEAESSCQISLFSSVLVLSKNRY